VNSLAWPVVALILAAIFRKPLLKILSQGLRRLKAGPVELEWSDLVSKAEESLPADKAVALDGSTRLPYVGDLVIVADQSPAAAVLMAFARIESALRNAVGQVGTRPILGMNALIRQAIATGLIPESLAAGLYDMREARNKAAHGVDVNDISKFQALEYLALSDSILSYVNDVAPPQP
jgi:hypothetical protein